MPRLSETLIRGVGFVAIAIDNMLLADKTVPEVFGYWNLLIGRCRDGDVWHRHFYGLYRSIGGGRSRLGLQLSSRTSF